MKGDDIAFVAKNDLLIVHFGESYLKRHKKERMEYACSNKMKEVSRLLIAYREMVNDDAVSFKDILKPKKLDNIVTATRRISGYDPLKKTFTAPSLTMHMGRNLKDMCDLLIRLILKECSGFTFKTKEESQAWIEDVRNFKDLIGTSWNIEISALTNKNLQEKRWNKTLLVPLVSDIKKFRDETLKLVRECDDKFSSCLDDSTTYKTFVRCLLALVIMFNRRRIGDVQYLKVKDYELERRSNFPDFRSALTDSENILTTRYKRIVNSGKGSRVVVILVPQLLQKFMKTLLEKRKKYIPQDNEYVFAVPNSKIKWSQGDVAIRFLAQKIDLKYPEAMTSNKLRKQIATVAQLLNLSKEEASQFSKFMGHTEKAHAEFYELPVDIYQTAKVSKLLMLMEKGSLPLEYRGKSLSKIQFDASIEYADECDEGERTAPITTGENLTSNNASSSKEDNCSEELMVDHTENVESPDSPVRKQKIKKTSWSNAEYTQIYHHFEKLIKKGKYPTSNEMKIFIKSTGIKRKIGQIRSKIQHMIGKINKYAMLIEKP